MAKIIPTITSANRSKPIASTLILVSIALVLADWQIASFYDILGPIITSVMPAGLFLFSAIVLVVYGAGQHLLLHKIRSGLATKPVTKKSNNLPKSFKVVAGIQYVFAGIFAAIIAQIFLFSQYHAGLTLASVAVSMGSASILTGLLSYRFFKWYKQNKRDIMMFSFFLTFLILAAVMGFRLFLFDGIIIVLTTDRPADDVVAGGGVQQQQQQPPLIIGPPLDFHFPNLDYPSLGQLGLLYIGPHTMLSVIPFFTSWLGVVLLMRQHYSRLGRWKFWALVILPMVTFLGGILPTLIEASSSLEFILYDESLLVYRMFFRFATMAGGIISAATFLIIGRNIKRQIGEGPITNAIYSYMLVASYGAILLSASFSTPVIHTPYPPFGLVASSFVLLSSYLFSVGIYSAAVSVAQDSRLRRSIKSLAMQEEKESNLLGKIGAAQMEQEIQHKVLNLVKNHSDHMQQETGVQSSMSEEEMQTYLQQVLREMSFGSKENHDVN